MPGLGAPKRMAVMAAKRVGCGVRDRGVSESEEAKDRNCTGPAVTGPGRYRERATLAVGPVMTQPVLVPARRILTAWTSLS